MVGGYVVDKAHCSGPTLSHWYQGWPEKSRWLGQWFSRKNPFVIRTYRCSECGYLESYASPVE